LGQREALTLEELMEIVPGPDFPTGALILGRTGCRNAYQTGRGSIIVRSRHEFEQRGDRRSIVLTEIPFQQGKNAL
ncbi:DNA gyrase subunit A, partial [Escherichia coli]|uniref:DNA gyrase subunit A n=1 Tax=Escherichia coli TaxID=562 RepID=UPI0013D323F2